MKSFVIKVAELKIRINCLYDLTFNLCKDYLCEDNDIDFEVSISEDDLVDCNSESIEYRDFIATHKAISKKLCEYNRLLVHGAAIEYNGLGYLFIAPSGTGKSTHIRLWKEYIKDVDIINGDKPIIDIDGYIYGTPWCGKERWNRNVKVKLGGIIILTRDNTNHIEIVDPKDYIKEILDSIDRSNIDSLRIIDSVIKQAKLYELGCDMSEEAVRICKEGLEHES